MKFIWCKFLFIREILFFAVEYTKTIIDYAIEGSGLAKYDNPIFTLDVSSGKPKG